MLSNLKKKQRAFQLLPSHKNFFFSFFLLQCLFINSANALRLEPDFIYGISFGYGGSGLDKTVIVENQKFDLSRAESPGMIGLSIETFIADQYSLGFSHRRGFRLGPFSSGVSFTGFILRRYFYNAAPILHNKRLATAITVQRWAPFVGLGTGLAMADTLRDGDVIANVDASAVYAGFHVGFDYQISPGLILRPEIFTSSSLVDVSKTPAKIEEFGVVCGFHFRL